MIIRVIPLVFALVLGGASVGYAQRGLVDGGTLDSLRLREEWWIGGRVSGMLMTNFGTLTVGYAGGTAPGSKPLQTATSGGSGYGIGAQAVLEYRPHGSLLGAALGIGIDYRHATAESREFVSQGIFAYHARFEAVSDVAYATVSTEARFRIGATGAFILAGLQVDVPVTGDGATLWQHEESTGTAPGETPGAPNTSIKFATTIDYATRLGLNVGVGHDFMVGLFGYRSQLVTPFAILQAATPVTSVPTSWNGMILRMGIMWRSGL